MNVKLTAQQKSKPIYTATDVYSIMQPILLRENKQRRKQEYFWVRAFGSAGMGIDDERYLQFVELLALGGQNRVHIKPAEAFRIAIQKNADFVIFVHNHPAGKLQPSPDDKDATDHLLKAAEVVDIKVVDHFIITEKAYYSFTEAGLLKQLRDSSTYRVLHEDEVALMQEKMAAEARMAEKTEIAVKLLALGSEIDFVVKATELKNKVVETNFKIHNVLKKKAQTVLDELDKKKHIKNIKFIKDIVNENPGFSRKVLKLNKLSPVIKLAFNDIKTLVKGHPHLRGKLKFNVKGNKFYLHSKNAATLYIKLMDDDFSKSELSEQLYTSIAKNQIVADE